MLEANIGLELFWLPRLQNHLADSLADGDWKDFDPGKRLRFSLDDHEWLVMDRLLETGACLVEEIAAMKAKKLKRAVPSVRPSESLRARDPWQ